MMGIMDIIIAISLLILASCQSDSPWRVSHVEGSRPKFASVRLSYATKDIVNGVGVEIVCTQGALRTYVDVYSQQIPPYQENENQAKVSLITAETTTETTAHRHEGGQRLTLTQDVQQLLIEALLQGKPVTLQLEGYATTLDPERFKEAYDKLQTSPFKNHFQLPFKL